MKKISVLVMALVAMQTQAEIQVQSYTGGLVVRSTIGDVVICTESESSPGACRAPNTYPEWPIDYVKTAGYGCLYETGSILQGGKKYLVMEVTRKCPKR